MSHPSSLNSLMKHLRDSGVEIAGSSQKRKLKNIGYYHGYKGYRFAGTAANRLPITDFNHIVLLHDFDMRIKTLVFPYMMNIETALKNYTLEAVLADAGSSNFDDIWRKSLTGYRCCSRSRYRDEWGKRQKLRQEIDGIIFRNHKTKDVIGHFSDADRDIPIWAIFEVMTLGNFGVFYGCLDDRVKKAIVDDLKLPSNQQPDRVLKSIIFALKDFRNAIAHNGVVIDVRFKNHAISGGVARLLAADMGVSGVDFSDITDYVVLLTYLMTKMKYPKTECKQLLTGYGAILEKYRAELPFEIYSKIILTSARGKLAAARRFVERS